MSLAKILGMVVLAGSLAVAPLPARAECTTARDCFQEGVEDYRNGNYDSALELFKKSYSQASERKIRADLLYNIGRVYENLGRPDLAREHFSLYLAENPQSTDRESIESRIEALSIYSHGKEIFNNEDFLGAAEIFKKVYGAVSDNNLRAVLLYDIAQSYEHAGKNELAIEYYNLYMGEDVPHKERVRLTIDRLSAPEEEIISEKPQENHLGSIVAGSVSALALIGGGAVGYLAKSKFDNLTDSCAEQGCPESDINGVNSLVTTANILFIVSGMAAAVALPLYFLERRDSVSVTASGVGVRF